MHEGERLKQVLADKGLTTADLRRACGITYTAVSKYYANERFGARPWARLEPALRKLGIDPASVRLVPMNASATAEAVPEDVSENAFKPILQNLPPDTWDAVLRLLNGTERQRHYAKIWLEASLSTRQTFSSVK
jgi:transcriptional regulator with XRE-family HTH domain